MGNGAQGKRRDKKNLSWIYRKKTKVQRFQKRQQAASENVKENKNSRIIVRNLPFKVTEDDVKQLYEPFGQIEEINLLRHPDGRLVGCGFVQFKRIEDASKAIFNTNKKEFLGRTLNSAWAISKSKFCEKLQKESAASAENTATEDGADNSTLEESKDEAPVERNKDRTFGNKLHGDKFAQRKQKERKLQKEQNRKKRARVVIRNLSFQATDENLKQHFSQYGSIEEVKILKRGDGKNVGCAFLQYDHVQSAAKAIHYANLQPLLGRPIIVDWAVPKNQFAKKNSDEATLDKVEVKIEKESDTEDSKDVVESNEEPGSDMDDKDETIKESDEAEESDDDSVTEVQEDEEEKYEPESDEPEVKRVKKLDEEEEEEEEVQRPRRKSHDISEGKTVFLKNVPFSIKNEQLKKYMERFGPVYYALVCMDPLTEFSKGTAFVKFKNVEDAEKCLSAGSELELEDQILEAHRALDKSEVENKASLKEARIKDSRNLYLVKEGVILAGSPAAVGVSASDMAKRLQIEQWKSQILRNLNMFVSRVRLVVHNIPPTMNDAKLRKIFENHSGPNAVIREARVMRDLRNIDAQGVGKSKEYAFVSFTNHQDALHALRDVNNNPTIFGPNRRPIISFSIENRIMVKAKERRIEKSREHNPLWQGSKVKRKNEGTEEQVLMKKSKVEEEMDESNKKPYAGTIGKPGNNKLRSKFNLKTQAMLHHQATKKDKKMNKSAKKLEAKKKEKAKAKQEIKPKQGAKVNQEDVKLDKLVDHYRNKLQSVEFNKSKWYET